MEKAANEFSGDGMALAGGTGSVTDLNNLQGSPLPAHDVEFAQCLLAVGLNDWFAQSEDRLCPV